MLLKDKDAVFKALELNSSKFKKRELRVTICGKRTKRMIPLTPRERTENTSDTKTSDTKGDDNTKDDNANTIKTPRDKKRKREDKANSPGISYNHYYSYHTNIITISTKKDQAQEYSY